MSSTPNFLEKKYIDRPPRIQPELPRGEIEVPAPPNSENQLTQSLIQLALPAVTILGYFLMAMFGRGRSMLMMIPMFISVVASIIYGYSNQQKTEKEQQKTEQAYRERLAELREQMRIQHDMQRRFYQHNYPSNEDIEALVDHSIHSIYDEYRDRTSLSRLWERQVSDTDFGMIRIGAGTRPSTVTYTLGGSGSFDNSLYREAMRLCEDSRFVTDVPITIPLCTPQVANNKDGDTAARHSLGVISPNRDIALKFTKQIVLQVSAFHAPTDAVVKVISHATYAKDWDWIKEMPHGGPNNVCLDGRVFRRGEQNEHSRYLDSPLTEEDKAPVREFLKEIRLDFSQRERFASEGVASVPPFTLIIVDLQAEANTIHEESPLNELESDPSIQLILNKGPLLRGAILFITNNRNKVPANFSGIIQLSEWTRDRKVPFRYAETGVNTQRHKGLTDLNSGDFTKRSQYALTYAHKLQPLMVRKSAGADLANAVLMLDMLGVQTMEELQHIVQKNWHDSIQAGKAADWLKVTLGQVAGGDYRTLKFSADADGVHGLIAGSTGSGKSELLMTMIMGLAVNYDPSIINFVLVDFKGGAAFKPFRNLPHCVDIVTNLAGAGVDRMFAAIRAELDRRQAINTDRDVKHIVHYRQLGLHEWDENKAYGQRDVEIRRKNKKSKFFPTKEYPHLFIFIDEFAEMIADNPDYKAQLDSITRLGRALGVTLILAAQRPTGVTDQMRANIKFRISLRVETREESSEILRKPDAAYLPTGIPGRGYLQIGNENLELIQVAWTGGDYLDQQQDKRPDVIWVDRDPDAQVPVDATADEDDEPAKVYEVMVDMMDKLSMTQSVTQRKPWPHFLTSQIFLSQDLELAYINTDDDFNKALLRPGGDVAPISWAMSQWEQDQTLGWAELDWSYAMRTIVGVIDNPHEAQQIPLMLNLQANGHALLFGASGWGKTTFLRTLLLSLAVTHSPNDLHAYILDLGSGLLQQLEHLPHVGSVVTKDQPELVQRLLQYLDDLLQARRRDLSTKQSESIYKFNSRSDIAPNEKIPATLLLLDNMAEFRDSFDELGPLLESLVRDGRAYGIHVVITADQPNTPGKLRSLIKEKYTLKLNDESQYGDIVGSGAKTLPDIAGRGFVRVGRRPLAFQIALPILPPRANTTDEDNDEEDFDTTKEIKIEFRELINKFIADFNEQSTAWFATHNIEANLPLEIKRLSSYQPLNDIFEQGRLQDKNEKEENKQAKDILRPYIGQDGRNLAAWYLDLSQNGPHAMILGSSQSGKTNAIQALALSLAYHHTPEKLRLIVVDFQSKLIRNQGNYTLKDLPHLLHFVQEAEEFPAVIDQLEYEYNENRSETTWTCVLIDNYLDFGQDLEAVLGKGTGKAIDRLSNLARRYGSAGLHFVITEDDSWRPSDSLGKKIKGAKYGLALRSIEAIHRLDGKAPRGLVERDMPIGRGFVVKAGQTSMIQIAVADEPGSSIISDQIEEIRQRNPVPAQWMSLKPHEEVTDQPAMVDDNPSSPSPRETESRNLSDDQNDVLIATRNEIRERGEQRELAKQKSLQPKGLEAYHQLIEKVPANSAMWEALKDGKDWDALIDMAESMI